MKTIEINWTISGADTFGTHVVKEGRKIKGKILPVKTGGFYWSCCGVGVWRPTFEAALQYAIDCKVHSIEVFGDKAIVYVAYKF